jgi:hypothetical protein
MSFIGLCVLESAVNFEIRPLQIFLKFGINWRPEFETKSRETQRGHAREVRNGLVPAPKEGGRVCEQDGCGGIFRVFLLVTRRPGCFRPKDDGQREKASVIRPEFLSHRDVRLSQRPLVRVA